MTGRWGNGGRSSAFLLDQVPGTHIVLSDQYNGETFFELAEKHGLDRIVSKRKGSKYRSGDTRNGARLSV